MGSFARLGRRTFVRGVTGAAIAAALSRWGTDDPEARKGKKRKNKTKVNRFGCRNVGVACSSANQCCSGICEGRGGKARNGRKLGRTCRAHDTGGCRIEGGACFGAPVPCVTSNGEDRFCEVTTGNAPYCAKVSVNADCRRDADCVGICGEKAACGVRALPGQEAFQFCAGPGSCAAE